LNASNSSRRGWWRVLLPRRSGPGGPIPAAGRDDGSAAEASDLSAASASSSASSSASGTWVWVPTVRSVDVKDGTGIRVDRAATGNPVVADTRISAAASASSSADPSLVADAASASSSADPSLVADAASGASAGECESPGCRCGDAYRIATATRTALSRHRTGDHPERTENVDGPGTISGDPGRGLTSEYIVAEYRRRHSNGMAITR